MLSREYLLEEYVKKGRSLRSIAREKDSSVYLVRKELEKHQVEILPNIEKLTKKINDRFFEKLTPESSFVLGYLMMDGDLQFNKSNDTYFLRLYSKYKGQLQLVKDLLEMEAKIQHRKPVLKDNIKQGEIFFLHIQNQTIITKLIEYGMIRNKNQSIKFPKIPEELLPYFLRGCWMGSGSVYLDKKGAIYTSFTIGSRIFIETLNQELTDKGLTERNIYRNSHSKKSSFYFRYATKDSLRLLDYIYKENYGTLKCERQVDTWNKYLRLNWDKLF